MNFRVPKFAGLNGSSIQLANILAAHSWLPNPDVVQAMPGPIFPSIRNPGRRGQIEGDLLLDDNTTPRWALFWAHGDSRVAHQKGWTTAHVWAAPKDREAYTCLANLALLPEALASLSDKTGPAVPYLQFHAWNTYGWKPANEATPAKPDAFDDIEWQYMSAPEDPRDALNAALLKGKSERHMSLRLLMGIER